MVQKVSKKKAKKVENNPKQPEIKKKMAQTNQIMMGRVVSTKTAKTVTVLVERKKMHPLYGKAFRRSKRYLVDDQTGVKLGDLVEIVKSRPLSKNKHWAIVKTVGKNDQIVDGMIVEFKFSV